MTQSSVYQSAFLTLLDRVCQFILASESVRDGLWTALSDSLFGSQTPLEQREVQHVSEFLSLLFASVEQLTGSPIKPLIKSFVAWIAVADDLLTKLASETRQLLAKPFATGVTSLSDYIQHPLGYVYSPMDTRAKFESVLQRWADQFLENTTHKDAFTRFKRHLDNVIIGIQGNSTSVRVWRDLRRVWFAVLGDPNSDKPGSGLEGALECFRILISELVSIPLGQVEIHDEFVDIIFSEVDFEVADVLPSEFSFNTHSTLHAHDGTFRTSTSCQLKQVQLVAKTVPFTYASKSSAKSQVSGTLDVTFSLDISIILNPKDKQLLQIFSSLPVYEGAKVAVTSADIKFYPASKEPLESIWPTLERHLITAVQRNVTTWTDTFLTSWLPTKPLVAVPKAGVKLPANPSPVPHRQNLSPSNGPETHGTARDRFKASIRDMTGLKAGSVISHLQNPLSGPSSPLISPGLDEDSMDAKRKRRQSMADHLTNISKADSTLPQNIQRPPVADCNYNRLNEHNLPNVFDDDEDELPNEYETMARSLSVCAERDTTSIATIVRPVVSDKADLISVMSHRGGMPVFPAAEMSYDAYEKAEAAMGQQGAPIIYNVGLQDLPSMAHSLSELTSRDTTTREAIENPPTVPGISPDLPESGENRTMDKVTRHLSGLPDTDESYATTPLHHGPMHRSGSHQHHPTMNVPMADLLTDKLMADNTVRVPSC